MQTIGSCPRCSRAGRAAAGPVVGIQLEYRLGGSRPRVTVLSCCGRFDKARCPFSAIAVCGRCSSSFEKRRQRRFGARGRPLQDPVGSGSERIELVKLLYAFSTRRLRWVRKTRIAWCDATFNRWVGCLRVSTACDRCYAAALSWRYGWRDATAGLLREHGRRL